jgi:phosphoribosyl 1,2-cyclic phosphodiesterase
MSLALEFWGVRGSIACPSPQYVQYGGNTSCIELWAGDERIILDAGTGIRELGVALQQQDVRKARLLLTHTHWDHINGFPFFGPGFHPGRHFDIMAGHLAPGMKVREVFEGQMAQPTFPVPLEAMKAELEFQEFRAGETFQFGAVTIKTAALNHPNGATGYRVEFGGRSVAYVTDTEHVVGRPDHNVLGLIAGADLVIYDCTYTDAEFPEHIGWGHSTWQEAIRLCRTAEAKQLAIFHHDPNHDDVFMHAVEREARQVWSNTLVARERMRLVIE